MNLLASYHYQINEYKKTIPAYYLILVGVMILLSLTAYLIASDHVNVTFNGLESISLIFLFVLGLCSFKESFLFQIQNGISRKTFFSAKLLTFVSAALAVCILDKVLFALLTLLSGMVSWINPPALLLPHWSVGAVASDVVAVSAQSLASSFLLSFAGALAALATGGLLTVLYYRLNRTGKIIVSISIPALLFGGVPMLAMVTNGAAIRWIGAALDFIGQSVFHTAGCDFLVFLLFSALTFLLLRKMPVKRN